MPEGTGATHRADGLLGEILAAAQGLQVATDPLLALALAAILAAMALDKAKPPLFTTPTAAQLAVRLLRVCAPAAVHGQSCTSRLDSMYMSATAGGS